MMREKHSVSLLQPHSRCSVSEHHRCLEIRQEGPEQGCLGSSPDSDTGEACDLRQVS